MAKTGPTEPGRNERDVKGVAAMAWIPVDVDARVRSWQAAQRARTSRSAALAALIAAGLDALAPEAKRQRADG